LSSIGDVDGAKSKWQTQDLYVIKKQHDLSAETPFHVTIKH